MFNQMSATFSNKTLGELTGYINYYDYNYFFNSILITPDEVIDNKLKGNEISVGGKYQKRQQIPEFFHCLDPKQTGEKGGMSPFQQSHRWQPAEVP